MQLAYVSWLSKFILFISLFALLCFFLCFLQLLCPFLWSSLRKMVSDRFISSQATVKLFNLFPHMHWTSDLFLTSPSGDACKNANAVHSPPISVVQSPCDVRLHHCETNTGDTQAKKTGALQQQKRIWICKKRQFWTLTKLSRVHMKTFFCVMLQYFPFSLSSQQVKFIL